MPDSLNIRDLSEQYGFAYAMLRSNDELYNLFKKAVGQTWTQDRIMTEVRATKWYKTNSESERNAQALKASDPATYRQGLSQQRVRVSMMANEYGARISNKKLNELANFAYAGGWDDNQLRRTLGHYIKYSDGRLLGQAGAMEAEWRQYADEMGVPIGTIQIRDWARRATAGHITPQDVLSRIREQAASKYAGIADRIKAGETVAAIAEPYKQAMGEILEMNPNEINIRKDKSIQRALTARDENGKQTLMPTWEFENKLREDPRWRRTNNAQDSIMETGRSVLKDLGLVN